MPHSINQSDSDLPEITPEVLYYFTRFIHHYGKSAYCGMIMTGKLLRHGYAR